MWKSFTARFALPVALIAAPALAEPPRVVTDIAPIHAITSAVLGELGEATLLLPPDADPHHYQMRPSQTRALAQADLLIWMGAAMTPWLGEALPGVNADAVSLELLELPDLPMLVSFDDPNHGDGEDRDEHAEGEAHDAHAEDEAHDDHDEHAENEAHDDHDDHAEGEAHEDHDDHHHDGTDPHAWMDPLNGAAFARAIGESLATADPANADQYRANAAAAAARYTGLADTIHETLHPVEDAALLPYHAAYTYFFRRFGLQELGGLADFEGAAPGAARLSDLAALMAGAPQACVFLEPGGNPRLPATVAPDAPVPGMLYPLGSNLAPGPELYPQLLRQIAETLADCAG